MNGLLGKKLPKALIALGVVFSVLLYGCEKYVDDDGDADEDYTYYYRLNVRTGKIHTKECKWLQKSAEEYVRLVSTEDIKRLSGVSWCAVCCKAEIADRMFEKRHDGGVSSYVFPSTSTSGDQYFLNTRSGVRHRAGCEWLQRANRKNIRRCSSDEGRPCPSCW